MKQRALFLSVFFMLLWSVGSANGATTLMQIGISPFYKPPLQSVDELKTMVAIREAEVREGFDLAGRSDLFEPFFAQIHSADIQLVQFPKGSYFEWMFYKKYGRGRVKIVRDVTWGAENTFPGYRFDIEHQGIRYTFAVPLGCGNIALMSETPIPVIEPPLPNLDPVCCGIIVSPVSAFCGEIVTVDASSSTDVDGEIVEVKIAFRDASGQIIAEDAIDGTSKIGEVEILCGENTLNVSVTDNEGANATSEQCTVKVTGLKRMRWLADTGILHQPESAEYLFGRVGMEYRLDEEFALLGYLGIAPKISGSAGATAFTADLMAEYRFSRYFVGFGVGGWITDGDNDSEDSQLDLIASMGARVYGEPESFNATLFLEIRAAIDELDDLADFGRFGLGVRFRF